MLTELPAEIQIEIAKALPTFSALKSFIRISPIFSRLLQLNQYTICGSVVRNEVGATLWPEVYQLLAQQAYLIGLGDLDFGPELRSLFHIDDEETEEIGEREIGPGVLVGGTRIGMTEVTEIAAYTQCVEEWKPFWGMQGLHIISMEAEISPGSRVNRPLPFDLMKSDEFTSDEHVRIDRAFYRLWRILLARVPEEMECYGRFEAALAGGNCHTRGSFWKQDQRSKPDWWNNPKAILEGCPRWGEKHIRKIWSWIKVVPELADKEKESELIELLMVCDFYREVPGEIYTPRISVRPQDNVQILKLPGTWSSLPGRPVGWTKEEIILSAQSLLVYFCQDQDWDWYRGSRPA